ncbi:hypothetical protein X798_06441 [Onchocerca flexuosa]|uniref:VLRF1 domain-containing protein n=1 Tax=Onchocerca flexuosa TaxID=387005 RepID=A0A238BPJ4_9BILA|nr:hypothetical protein X798_06441 [Onchocerca flexuosa]
MPFTGGAHAYFISDGTVYSIYRCILLKNEIISRNLFQRPLDCVILLLSAGHFCGGIFKNHELVTNKSFHRYVIRAKQGTTQSASDARGSAAKSAGASEEKDLGQQEIMVNLLSKVDAQALYSCIRLNSISKLHQLFESNKERKEDFLKYIREMRFPPASSTFLHIVARRGTVEILEELLLLGCDPAVKDDEGKVPYQVAQNRTVRQAFSKFRFQHPDAFNWNVSQIPELAVMSEEQLRKEVEKKRIQREKKKERLKAKKIAEHQERIEQEQRQKYLALSDREKRALAAERRLAASLQRRCQIVENDGSRCFKCATVLPVTHFEYCDNHFCSLACLQQHRQEHSPQLV